MSSQSKNLRKLALKSVINPDPDYFYRHVFRWYSKTFYTPLHIVEELPLDLVLLNYYETRYEEIVNDEDHSKLIEELQELLETDQQRMIREMMNSDEARKVEDDEFIKKLIDEEKAKKKPKTIDDLKVKPPEPLLLNKPDANPRIVEPFKDLPDINMNFSNLDPEEIETWDVFGPPRKKDK